MKDSNRKACAQIDRAVGALSLPVGARVLAAVSGGADSVALLRALARVAPEHHWELLVAHVEHGLRGDESLLDAAFVRALASRLDLPYEQESVDVMALVREHGISVETAARELRYGVLNGILHRWNGDVIATGHTLNDQAETFLLHLLRGAGIVGLASMRTHYGAVVRPLLPVDRETILRALQEEGQGYRVDSTNEDERHMRARLRRGTLPALRDVQPRVEQVLARAAGLLADDASLLVDEARRSLDLASLHRDTKGIVLSRAVVAALHPALRRALLREAILDLRGSLVDVTERQIASIVAHVRGDSSSPLELPAGMRVACEGDTLSLQSSAYPAPPASPDVELALPGEVGWGSGVLTSTVGPRLDDETLERLLAVIGPLHALVDAERLAGSLVVGARHPGDRVKKPGSIGTSSVKKLFIDRKVPRAERTLTPVVRDGAGPVWIAGVTVDERVAISPQTRHIAHLCYRPKDRPAC